jgi:hypothetical protein
MSSYNASTKYQQCANIHCRQCTKEFFFSITDGINVVLVRYEFGKHRILNQKHKFKLDCNEFISLQIWCPNCNRIENKEVYEPNWKKVENIDGNISKKVRNDLPQLQS